MTGVIETWAAGKALNVGASGAARLVGLLRGERDALGRLLVLLHADFGEECDLDRDVFYAWRAREDLVAVFDRALRGTLRGSASDVQLVADVIEPRLVRSAPVARRELAKRIAGAVFAAVALVVEGGDGATRLLLARIDALGGDVRELLDGRTPADATPGVLFNVPVMTSTFIGREDALQQLAAGLSGEGAVAVTQVDAIHGLGGVGKTQLAARYARTHRDAYEVIWWLRAEQPATLGADLAALAVALGVVDVTVDEPDAVAAAREWLERNRRWLLVFDNAPGPGVIAELVPEGEGGHVLITSRAHADWRSLGARPVALDVWEREESVTFLTARTEEHDQGVLDELADALGDLPLALEQAAAYITTKAITAAGYLGRLRDRAPELLDAGRPVGYEHTTATVWSLAFTELAHQPVATRLVGVCAHGARAHPAGAAGRLQRHRRRHPADHRAGGR